MERIRALLFRAVHSSTERLSRAASYCRELVRQIAVTKKAWLEFSKVRREWKEVRRRSQEEAPAQFPIAVGSIISGALYLLLFTPLCIVSAIKINAHPLDILFLQELSGGAENSMFFRWWEPEARPTAYAVGALYGGVLTSYGLLMLTGGIGKVVLSTLGIFFGYLGTNDILNLTGAAPSDSLQGYTFIPRFGWILVLNLTASSLTGILGGEGYEREKYETVLHGIAGLLSGAILARGFGGASEWFVGSVFLVIVFFSSYLLEHVYIPTMIFMKKSFGDKRFEAMMETQRRVSIRAVIRAVRNADPFQRYAIRITSIGLVVGPLLYGLICNLLVRAIS